MVWPDLRVNRFEIFNLDTWPERRINRAFMLHHTAFDLLKKWGVQISGKRISLCFFGVTPKTYKQH